VCVIRTRCRIARSRNIGRRSMRRGENSRPAQM
jgi:hypothetical protein